MKNAVIEGKNYYGTIGTAEIAKNVTTNFENISYTGPQFLRNSGGTANFFGNNTFEIANVDSVSPVKQFAEVTNMSIADNFDVKHLDVETVNHFKLGYWQSYGLILEGSIDNADYDLTNPDNVHKVISLYSSSNTEVLSVNCENTDWYNTEVCNGYQSIITKDALAQLPSGIYKLVISMSIGDHYDSEDLDVTSESGQNPDPNYHTIFEEIGSTTLPSNTTATSIKEMLGIPKLVETHAYEN
ncbi:hypothetical protein ACFC3Z_11695 [Enterococcus thailandicus]|uniref:hypothetical protein n=1 Tax=Enterococcus thailandicus TaxID=417368 RepID=UPI0035DE8F56